MPLFVYKVFLSFAFNALLEYLKNDSSSSDEKVLNVVKKSCDYLANKENNTVDLSIKKTIDSTKMIEGV